MTPLAMAALKPCQCLGCSCTGMIKRIHSFPRRPHVVTLLAREPTCAQRIRFARNSRRPHRYAALPFALLAELRQQVREADCALRYGVWMIAFERFLEAPRRWPAVRAHTDLTHSPEMGLAHDKQILEQCARGRDLP